MLDGKNINVEKTEDKNWLNDIYRSLKLNYPKFFKMDNLSKAGFLASELIFKNINIDNEQIHKDIAIILFNSVSSLDDDIIYQQSISEKDNFFPSPAVFVYTLANIVNGEIAIRNKIQAETAFYIIEKYSEQHIETAIKDVFCNPMINSALCGWINVLKEETDVHFMYFEKQEKLI